MKNRTLIISNLTHIYTNKATGNPQLSMAEITGYEELASFTDLRDYVFGLRYPKPQADKLECYGWVPTLYMPSDRTFHRSTGGTITRHGCWRTGEAEADEVSVFYADVDNANLNAPFVTMADVADRLNDLGLPLSFFMYSSFSYTEAKPKFRVVIETDRDITRTEMLRLGAYLNVKAFGKQADLSIYDPGDFVFAPPHRAITLDQTNGGALVVDDTLSLQAALPPNALDAYVAARQPRTPKAVPTQQQRQALAANAADRTIRPEVSTANRSLFNLAWLDLYRQRVVGSSHWKTMRSILGMTWAKAGGLLTYGEMDLILREVDAAASGYFVGKYGEEGVVKLLTWLLAQPVEPRAQDWRPVLEQDDTGLVIEAKEAECGEGKTRDELQRIVRERGRYVYVVPKIDNMEERRREFREIAGDLTAYQFTIKEAHSRTEGDLRVPLQLVKIRQDLDRLPAGKPIIVFVTQQGATQMDWSAWGDFEIVFDEVPEVFSTFKIKAKSHASLIREYVHVATEDGDCYRLALTGKGRDLAASSDIDDYDAVHYGLTLMMARDNTYVWVKRAGWDDPGEHGCLEFFAITSPLNLLPFKRVRMLGDEMSRSVAAEVWAKKWGVRFDAASFPRRVRRVPTSERVSIIYYSEHRDSSITRFKEGDIPLAAISDHIVKDAAGEAVLWTANERVKGACGLPAEDFVSPRSHGRNDLQHYSRVAWLAAMKASKFEISSLNSVCGMTSQALTDWREYNALYQFVMRSILRDFDSAAPVMIYVFSRKQAEYLQGRLGGTIRRAPGVVIDEPTRALDIDGPMTPAERSKVKHWRDKMLAAGVADVRQLPPSGPLSKLSEREVRLINRTASRVLISEGEQRLAA